MPLNRCFFDFHLLAEGWLSLPPRDQANEETPAPAGCVATICMIEFSSDERPDIWYKAEILQVCSNQLETKSLIEKYGLPNAILVNCSAQEEELRMLLSTS